MSYYWTLYQKLFFVGVLLLEEMVNSCGGEGIVAIIDAAKQQFIESQSKKVAGNTSWWRVLTEFLFVLLTSGLGYYLWTLISVLNLPFEYCAGTQSSFFLSLFFSFVSDSLWASHVFSYICPIKTHFPLFFITEHVLMTRDFASGADLAYVCTFKESCFLCFHIHNYLHFFFNLLNCIMLPKFL